MRRASRGEFYRRWVTEEFDLAPEAIRDEVMESILAEYAVLQHEDKTLGEVLKKSPFVRTSEGVS